VKIPPLIRIILPFSVRIILLFVIRVISSVENCRVWTILGRRDLWYGAPADGSSSRRGDAPVDVERCLSRAG
jgi:hypothetical protein